MQLRVPAKEKHQRRTAAGATASGRGAPFCGGYRHPEVLRHDRPWLAHGRSEEGSLGWTSAADDREEPEPWSDGDDQKLCSAGTRNTAGVCDQSSAGEHLPSPRRRRNDESWL